MKKFQPYRTSVVLPQGVVDNLGEAQIFVSLPHPETRKLSIAIVPRQNRYRLAATSFDPSVPALIWINPRNQVDPLSGALGD